MLLGSLSLRCPSSLQKLPLSPPALPARCSMETARWTAILGFFASSLTMPAGEACRIFASPVTRRDGQTLHHMISGALLGRFPFQSWKGALPTQAPRQHTCHAVRRGRLRQNLLLVLGEVLLPSTSCAFVPEAPTPSKVKCGTVWYCTAAENALHRTARAWARCSASSNYSTSCSVEVSLACLLCLEADLQN